MEYVKPWEKDSFHVERGEDVMDLMNYALSVFISLAIGLTGFIIAYKIFDWLTPGVHFADQLKADNKSVAIFLAGLFIGLKKGRKK